MMHERAETARPISQYSVAAADGRRSVARHRWWLWLVLLALIAAAAYFAITRLFVHSASDAASARSGQRPVPVVAATAANGQMNLYLTGLGTVTPYNIVSVRTRVDGQIMNVEYVEGQMVHAGDALVEIDPRPFQVQLTQAEGQLAKDQALLKNAQLDLERYKSIRESVTQQQIDTQQALVSQYEGAAKSDQGQVDNAKLQLVYCHITAPISGRLGLRPVDVGNIVHASDLNPVAVITQLQPITVVFTLSEDDLTQVIKRPDHGQGLPVDAYDRDLNVKLASGKLLAIDNQVDPSTGTVRIKAEFANQDNALFPNQFVNARLLVNTLQNVVIVPNAAVQRGPDSTFVYVVKGDQTVALRNITTGPSEGDETVISHGVTAGETVVTDGVDKLQDGSKVSVRTAPAVSTSPPRAVRRGATTRPSTQPARRTTP